MLGSTRFQHLDALLHASCSRLDRTIVNRPYVTSACGFGLVTVHQSFQVPAAPFNFPLGSTPVHKFKSFDAFLISTSTHLSRLMAT